MANTVDELIVEIKADTKQLQSELRKINGKIKLTGATGGAAFAGMGASIGKARVGALALAAGLLAVGKSISAIAKIGMGFEDLKDSLDQVFGSIEAGDAAMNKVFKFAQTTPFQIEDATKAFIALKSAGIEPSMEMLQTFADTASVSVDSLGTFEALVRMVQRGASGGMGLEELNMISDKGIDVLGILKEKLNLTKDDIAKFGKTAEGAAEMVKALTEGLQEKFGGAMDAKMDNLSTKTSNMTIAFKQLADEIFKSKLGDLLKSLTDRLTAFANAASRAVRIASGRATEDDIQTEIGLLRAKIQNNSNAQGLMGLEADPAERNIMEKLLFGNKSVEEMRRQITMFEGMLDRIKEAKKKAEVEGGAKKTTTGFIAGDVEGLIEFQSKYNKLVQDAIPESKKLGDQIEYIQNLLATDNQEELQGVMAFLGTDEEGMQKVVNHLILLKDELKDVPTMTDEMTQAIVNASQAFTSDFVNSLLDGENALESFKNFARSIVSQIITIFMQMAVVNQILNSVFGLTGANALPTFKFGGGSAPVTGVSAGQGAHGGHGGVGMGSNASGGTVQAGMATVVGETGAEIFVPNSGGKILNSMNSKNALGGGGTVINQSINFATGVVPTVRAEVMKMMPQIADVTKGAVAEAAMRGGNYRRALQGG
tara:strand:+ start:240 stop:2201 length:1962 start_codon:yes stop_codon:yes gene_type:complete